MNEIPNTVTKVKAKIVSRHSWLIKMNSLTSVDSKQGNESKNSKTYGTPCPQIIYTAPYRKQTGNGPEGVQQYVLHTKFGQLSYKYWANTEPFELVHIWSKVCVNTIIHVGDNRHPREFVVFFGPLVSGDLGMEQKHDEKNCGDSI